MKKLIIFALMCCIMPVFFAACDDTSSTNTNYSITLLTDPDSDTISKAAHPNVLLKARVYDSKGDLITSHGNITWVLKYQDGGSGDYIKIPDDWFTSSKPYTNGSLNIEQFFNGDVAEISAYYSNAKQTVTFTIIT